MASSHSSLEENLKCSICFEIFKDPVLLHCSHSFCKACLDRSWSLKDVKECPLCRKITRCSLLNNLVLKDACESLVEEKKRRILAGTQGAMCLDHAEKLQLYCVDDQKLVCLQCVAWDHQDHSFCSIKKAASNCKEELKTSQEALEVVLNEFDDFKSNCEKITRHIKVQKTEMQIKEEFEKLHQFLREEEEARIAELREEEEEKMKKMEEMFKEADGECSILAQLTQEVDAILNGKDDDFLQNYKDINERAQYTIPSLQLDSQALIDVAKHLGNLRYKVWEKMKDLCPYFPVILDPNSAHETLTLSEDLTSLSREYPRPDFPNNPERFTVYPIILGSEGFNAGIHSWMVEVKDCTSWIIGVAKESVKRKEKCSAVPAEGIWAVSLNNNKYSWTSQVPTTKYQRLKIQLNLEAGEVKFFSDDSFWPLHSYTERFTEKIYPFFNCTCENPVKILPVKITVQKTE
ncbi:zinc-binding protein A33-like isoform X2 [Salminus brasiliensis]|uniref:zinc-binding protein A33-like isoform X2 n=1 Tax=Salminus brasiliensis TaxID=930266 RepID=UPI003B838C4F